MKKNSYHHTKSHRAGWFRPVLIFMIMILISAAIQTIATAEDEQRGPLRIVEYCSDNKDIPVDGNTVCDFLVIRNEGDETVDLGRYILYCESSPLKFTLLNGRLGPGEKITILCDGSGTEGHAAFKLASSGNDAVVVTDDSGTISDEVELAELKSNEICTLNGSEWVVTDNAGQQTGDIFCQGDIEITEIMTKNTLYTVDQYGVADYVELHNTLDRAVDLSGWYLSDNGKDPKKWSFPENTVIEAGAYLAVPCRNNDIPDDRQIGRAMISLGNSDEGVFLSNSKGELVSSAAIQPLEKSQVLSYVNGAWHTDLAPTPGAANDSDSIAEVNRRCFNNDVYISEICAVPDEGSAWIEIHNASDSAVDLGRYYLSNKVGRPREWNFPQGTSIPAGGYICVFCENSDESTINDIPNTGFSLAEAGGYTITFSDETGKVLDALYIPLQREGISYGRSNDRSQLQYFMELTPGAANAQTGYAACMDEPVFSVSGGVFQAGESLSLTLSSTDGVIRYTTDCSDPTADSPIFAPEMVIPINSDTVIRARVFKDNCLESNIATQSYLFDADATNCKYVVSLVSDPDGLYSNERGIMVAGNGTDKNANYFQNWEREGYISIVDTATGEQVISQRCGIKMHGNNSRKLPWKSLKIIARKKYGSSRFYYPLFSNRNYTEYKALIIRGSGQDYNRTFMRDSVLTSLAKDTSLLYQESEFILYYLNGEYYSMAYLRESIDVYTICQFEGWVGQESDIDFKGEMDEILQGSYETYSELNEYLSSHDPNTQETIDKIESITDLQNYFAFMAIQMYAGAGDSRNMKLYRNPNADGKWHWVLYDLDHALEDSCNTVSRWLNPKDAGNNNSTDNKLILAVINNDELRDRYLTYFGEQLATTLASSRVTQLFADRYELIKPQLARYLAKCGKTEEDYNSEFKKLYRLASNRTTLVMSYLEKFFQFSDAEKEKYLGAAYRNENSTGNSTENS